MLSDEYCIPVNDEQDSDSSHARKKMAYFRSRKPDFWFLSADKFGKTCSLRSGLCSAIHEALIDSGVDMPLTQEQFEELLINQGDNGLRFVANNEQEFMVYASNKPQRIARKIIKMLNK